MSHLHHLALPLPRGGREREKEAAVAIGPISHMTKASLLSLLPICTPYKKVENYKKLLQDTRCMYERNHRRIRVFLQPIIDSGIHCVSLAPFCACMHGHTPQKKKIFLLHCSRRIRRIDNEMSCNLILARHLRIGIRHRIFPKFMWKIWKKLFPPLFIKKSS